MIVLSVAGPAYAALAPVYERVRQFQAVLADRNVISALTQGGPIDRITYSQDGVYRVGAGRCEVEVRLRVVPQPMGQPPIVGAPIEYAVILGKTVCR